VNTSKTAKGGGGISYGQGKKRHAKANTTGSRRNSFSTHSNSGVTDETSSRQSTVQKSDFRILRTIGRGTYGKVYLV